MALSFSSFLSLNSPTLPSASLTRISPGTSKQIALPRERRTNLIRKTFTNANRELALKRGVSLRGVGKWNPPLEKQPMCELWHEKAATAHSGQGQPNLIDVDVSATAKCGKNEGDVGDGDASKQVKVALAVALGR